MVKNIHELGEKELNSIAEEKLWKIEKIESK